MIRFIPLLILCIYISDCCNAQSSKDEIKVIAFFTARNDQAHISFVKEANRWFARMAVQEHFHYDTSSNWQNCNSHLLAGYNLVIFLDTRPDVPEQRLAFQQYMESGGAWMGFHFAGFALTPSDFPQNWDWYHNVFLGSGSYVSNTWRPVSAMLRIEKPNHPALKHLPILFKSAPNEWYRWSNDLRNNPDIQILLSIDSSSFPLGTGPKPSEIWHQGYYPVVWTNKKFRMIYMNMGHNDIDYENKTNKTLSYQFANATQSQLVLQCLRWLCIPQNPKHQ
jgi:hypothetical protein